MHRIVTNNFRPRFNGSRNNLPASSSESLVESGKYVPQNAKFLAWGIFLFFFIENGTLGLLPTQFYYLYRNVKISDLIQYFLIIYSFYCSKEYIKLLKSKALIIVYILFIYYILQFLISVISYNQNLIEYFFRLKFLWGSFLVFPFLLLMQRNGMEYLIKIILPVAILSNILYIITAITGVAMLPNVFVYKQDLPGGLEVYRVYGGTFYGEYYFLGFMFLMITRRFRISYLILALLFVLPHILAFGRGAWANFGFAIISMIIWNTWKKRGFKVIIRQAVLFSLILVALYYAFNIIIPESQYMTEALQSRVTQGQEDVKYSEGTYGSRVANIAPIIELWQHSNILFGIGMHPFWVIKPETADEAIYYWGFCDTTWPPVLAVYGLVGFLLYAIFQIYYIYVCWKILKKSIQSDLLIFLTIACLSSLVFAILNYTYGLFSMGIYGIGSAFSFLLASLIFGYETKVKK